MADGATNVHVLRSFPCEPKDYNTAHCRMGLNTMSQLELIVGSSIRIKTDSDFVYCSVWPMTCCSPEDKVIQFDPLVTRQLDQDTERTVSKREARQCLKVPEDFTLLEPLEAVLVTVSLYMSNDDESEDSHLSRAALEKQRARRVSILLRGLTIVKGCSIKLKQARNYKGGIAKGIARIVIESIDFENVKNCCVRVTEKSKITVQSAIKASSSEDRTKFVLAGLDESVQMLQELLQYPFQYPESFVHLGLDCPKGILLQGAPGVGKTLLVRTVTADCGAQLVALNGTDVFGPHSGESEENLRRVFEKARFASRSGPCVLFIDELDALCPKRGSSGSEEENRIVAQLLTLMDGLESRGRVVVIGATNRPNAIDPALRRPGRFDREVVIGVPNAFQRLAILHAHTEALHLADDVNLTHLAEITVGYVGADLASLCRQATFTALKRSFKMGTSLDDAQNRTEVNDRKVRMSDFQLAMCHIVPSTHRGMEGLVNLHPISWKDIGGLQEVKQALIQAIEWPLKYPEAFSRLGLRRPRGVLLYGPPGCCKTTLVRAAASSSHCTFLSLSCAQLYSPYVGDAERMIREIFLKARATAPCILFLDELDSLASKRTEKGGSGVETRLLASLLNEMDGVGVSANIYGSDEQEKKTVNTGLKDWNETTGIEHVTEESEKKDMFSEEGIKAEVETVEKEILEADLKFDKVSEKSRKLSSNGQINKTNASLESKASEVIRLQSQNIKDLILVAATNRPGAIDEALLRPGRIDRIIYVPPPDLEARLEILKVHTRASPLADDVDLNVVAERTDMFTGADLENLCREAALFALEEKGMSACCIDHRHFKEALDNVNPSLTCDQLSYYQNKQW